MFTFCLRVLAYMYVHALCACRDRKRISGPLELEFQTAVSYCVGAEN